MRALLLWCWLPALLAAQTIEPARLQEDFRILRQAVEEGHPGIYRYTPRAELDRIFAKTAHDLNRPMTTLEFYRVLSPAVAALKCGHTPLLPPEQLQKQITDSVPLIPVLVRILDGKLYIGRDYAAWFKPSLRNALNGGLAGAEILAINEIPAERILRTLLASIHGDGDSPTAGPWRLGPGRQFARVLYALTGIESPFRIHCRLAGKTGEAVLAGHLSKKIEELAKSRYPADERPAAMATYRTIQDGTIGVLKVSQFGGVAEDGKPLNVFFQNVYNDLAANNIANLIIDVRGNGGGADELGKQLFSYLVTEPFPYYNDLVINKLTFDFFRYAANPEAIAEKDVEKRANGKYLLVSHPNWGTQQPGKPAFTGKVFALMNGGSFSTTCEFLSTLHHHRRAAFIGEEAAGGYYGNTSGPRAMLVLPNSKIRVPVPLMTYYMAIEGAEYGNRSIPADHAVHYSIEELLAGKDKELELALQLIAAQR